MLNFSRGLWRWDLSPLACVEALWTVAIVLYFQPRKIKTVKVPHWKQGNKIQKPHEAMRFLFGRVCNGILSHKVCSLQTGKGSWENICLETLGPMRLALFWVKLGSVAQEDGNWRRSTTIIVACLMRKTWVAVTDNLQVMPLPHKVPTEALKARRLELDSTRSYLDNFKN